MGLDTEKNRDDEIKKFCYKSVKLCTMCGKAHLVFGSQELLLPGLKQQSYPKVKTMCLVLRFEV